MAPKPSAPSNRSGGSKNPPPKKNVVIASITSTKSANHATTTTTTSFNKTGSTSSSSSSTSSSNRPPVVRPPPPPPPSSSDRPSSAEGSSLSSSSAAAARPNPPGPVGRSSRASAPPRGGGGASNFSSTSAAAAAGPVKPVVVHVGKGGKNAIIVNARQRGNPIMNHIKNVAWEYGDIVPDYVVGQHTCILYLSLRYHRLHPEYLHQRIEKLGGMYQLRVLLVMCDVSDHQDPIREISKVCIINNLTVMVCWTPEEAGLYLATYKIYEHKPPDILKEKVHNDYRSYLNRSLTGIKGVNKTDVLTLSSSFGTFDRIIHASPEELSVCPGVGETKVRRLVEAFTGKFKGSSSSSRPSAAAVPSTQGGVAKVIAVAAGNAEDVDDEEEEEILEVSKKGKGKGRLLDGKGNTVVVEEEEEEEEAPSDARKGAQKEYSPDWPDDEEEETPLPPMSPEWEDDEEEDGGEPRPRAEGKKIARFSDDDDEEEEEEERDAKKKKGRELTVDSP